MLRRVRRYAFFSVVASLAMAFVSLANGPVGKQAYLAVEAFAPWNLIVSYVRILTIHDDPSKQFPALRPFEPSPEAAAAGEQLTNDFSLTRHSTLFLRPITALIDLLLHLLSDSGAVGFIYAVIQLTLGFYLMLLFFRGKERGFYFYSIGVPLGTVVLASIAAIPLWVIALFGVFVWNSVASISLQTCFTTGALLWVRDKVAEPLVHEGVMQGLERGVEKATKTLMK